MPSSLPRRPLASGSNRRPAALILFLSLSALSIATVRSAHAQIPPDAVEPTGGRWSTVVVSSGNAIKLAPPPVANSTAANQELAELRAMQASRTAAILASIDYWNAGACLRWNEIARQLVVRRGTNPPQASRVYALLSVAQYDALVVAWNNKFTFNRVAPPYADHRIQPLASTPRAQVYPSEHAVVAGASAAVLSDLYPADAAFLADLANQDEVSRLWAGVNYRSDITAGDGLGRAIAATVLERAATDGAGNDVKLTVPPGTSPGGWYGTNPLLPLWGSVKPWLMSAGSAFRPAAPPAPGSAEFLQGLAEVRQISDTRTPEQLQIAIFWADGAGTVTPPGHWNQIAADLLATTHWSEVRISRALSLMNMAMMDAGICCWDAKYTYWLIRPSQADPLITTPVGLPNFPSFTSGHSSFSGAAASVLGYLLPHEANSLQAMAEQAAISRLYGGIHYRFDSEVGLENGRGIAALAIARAKSDGAPGL